MRAFPSRRRPTRSTGEGSVTNAHAPIMPIGWYSSRRRSELGVHVAGTTRNTGTGCATGARLAGRLNPRLPRRRSLTASPVLNATRMSSVRISGSRLPVLAAAESSVRYFFAHRMTTYAAALAYRGLFGLFPFVLLLVVLASALGLSDFLERLLEQAQSRPPSHPIDAGWRKSATGSCGVQGKKGSRWLSWVSARLKTSSRTVERPTRSSCPLGVSWRFRVHNLGVRVASGALDRPGLRPARKRSHGHDPCNPIPTYPPAAAIAPSSFETLLLPQ